MQRGKTFLHSLCLVVIGQMTADPAYCQNLKAISEELLSIDKSEFGAGSLVSVDFGSMVTSCNGSDVSPKKFISRFDPAIKIMPTFKEFYDLFDNYNHDVSVTEDKTAEEQAEEDAFLDIVLASQVMSTAYTRLVEYGAFNGSKCEFRAQLKQMWFGQYSRGGTTASSSGFEHVFIGEIDVDKVGGFHQWVRFYDEENKGSPENLQFYGNYVSNDFGDGYGGYTNYFYWLDIIKCIGGGFYGTSPALDMAVYSICWILYPESLCRMSFNGVEFDIQSRIQDTDYIYTTYPIFY